MWLLKDPMWLLKEWLDAEVPVCRRAGVAVGS
jgi:hypothetical protein